MCKKCLRWVVNAAWTSCGLLLVLTACATPAFADHGFEICVPEIDPGSMSQRLGPLGRRFAYVNRTPAQQLVHFRRPGRARLQPAPVAGGSGQGHGMPRVWTGAPPELVRRSPALVARGPMTALLVRWSVLAALLVAELLALTVRFDTRSLARQPQWWARAVGASPMVPGILIAVFTAIVIFGGVRLKDAIGQMGSSGSRFAAFLALLLAVSSLFARRVHRLDVVHFRRRNRRRRLPWLVVLWLGGGGHRNAGVLGGGRGAAEPLALAAAADLSADSSRGRGRHRRLPLRRHGRRTLGPDEQLDLRVGPRAAWALWFRSAFANRPSTSWAPRRFRSVSTRLVRAIRESA